MSTIPSTLSARSLPYTVVGGAKGPGGPGGVPVSVLLLDRGNRLYRGEVLRELDRLGFESVISVEPAGESLDLEALARRWPGTRFLMPGAPASVGEIVNVGIRESRTPWVFVLQGDMRLSSAGLSSRFFERLAEQERLCVAPYLSTRKGELLPSAALPAMDGQGLRVLGVQPDRDGCRSVYPFDYAGIYSREKFVLTGGYDADIKSPYWQKLDFGFRAWLWGEEIRLSQALRVAYEEAPPVEDESPGEDYKWFWLKNLSPAFRGDSAGVPVRRLWSYLRSRRSPVAALGEFRAALAWVKLNRYRFKTDATSLVDLWEEEAP